MTGTQNATTEEYAVMPIGGGLTDAKDRDLIGSKIKNPQGENLGTLENLIVDTKTGKIAYGVISLPEKEHMMPVQWSAFKVNREKGEVVLNVKLDQLQPAVEATDAKDKSPSVQKLVKDIERTRAEGAKTNQEGLGVTKQPAAGGGQGEDQAAGSGPGGPRALPPGQAPGFKDEASK